MHRHNIQIPANWKWVRLGQIFFVRGGKRLPRGWKLVDLDNGEIYLRVSDMHFGTIVPDKIKFAPSEVISQIDPYRIASGDLYLTIAGTIGRVGIIPEKYDGALLTENASKLVPPSDVKIKFMYYLLSSSIVQEQFTKLTNSVAQPKLSLRSINQIVLPIPPLAEQERILKKIEILMRSINTYRENSTKLLKLDDGISIRLKSAILQFAMQGKLTQQDFHTYHSQLSLQNDQVLDKRLRDRSRSSISESHSTLPYRIPSSWNWMRLEKVVTVISGRDLKKSEYNDSSGEGIPYITGATNFISGKIETSRFTEVPSVISVRGDLLITVKGTIGELAFNPFPKSHIARQVMALRIIDPRIIGYSFLKLILSLNTANLKQAATSIIPGISRKNLLNLNVQIPPIKEQEDIVKLFESVSSILKNEG